jgi:ribosomal protein S18 acetylase RimI-like enzyme
MNVLARAHRDRLVLEDGTTVLVRGVAPGDKALLRDGFERLSPRSRRLRFFAPKARLSEPELRYFTEVDGTSHLALIATVTARDGREQAVAVARYACLRDRPEMAEAAITVADDYQGRGIGLQLSRRIMTAAAQRGVKVLRCEVLSENAGMRRLLYRVAPDAKRRFEGTAVTFELPVAPVAASPA